MTLFDAQLHPAALRAGDLADLSFFGVSGALALADTSIAPVTREAVRRAWEAVATAARRRLPRAGIAGFAAVGIHPRFIPWRGLEALLAELPDHLGRPEVVALGAVGLEEGGAREELVLSRQLELARELRLPVVVHTPWRARERTTRRILAMLREQELDPQHVLVTRADARTVRMIRACGYTAGLSLSSMPARGDVLDEVVRIVRALGPEGIVLGSGAGDGGGDLLGVPRAAARLQKSGLSAAVIRRVCGRNARALLRIGGE